jgi:hypothetical protein
MAVRVAILTLVLAVSGCGNTASTSHDRTDTAPAVHVCDGAQALRLRFFKPGVPSKELRGSGVRVENGYPSFAVDGKCSYWMNAGWFNGEMYVDSRDLGWRSGQVDADLEAELDTLPLGHLDTLADCMTNSVFDSAPWVISDESSGAGCVASGPRHLAAIQMVSSRAVDLWARATPLSGGLWLSAVVANEATSKAYAWPVQEPLASFVIPDDPSGSGLVGVSRLVEDAAVAAQLRALKAQYIEDRKAAPGLFLDGQKMSDGVTDAIVYMRDQLPYEDEHGLLPLDIPK